MEPTPKRSAEPAGSDPIAPQPLHARHRLTTVVRSAQDGNLPSSYTAARAVCLQKPRLFVTLRALDALDSQPVPRQANRRQSGLSAGTALVLVIAAAFFALAAVQLLRPPVPHVPPGLEGKAR